jgi:hypothetical protein
MPSIAAFAVLLALPLWVVAATAKPVPEGYATLIGTIVDDSGRPAKDATVYVNSAHLKNGYARVCPTCWIDCGKRADTDAQGQFTITGLNPNLKFRLIILKEGFIATAKGGVDPTQGPLQPIKLTPRTASLDDAKIVHGRVTDVAGNPIAGALIEPVLAIVPGGGMWVGAISWMDQLAATNATGEFEIVASKPVEKVMLKISPRGLAPQLVTEPPGPAINSVVLTEGATIVGRLVAPNGAPISDAEVVLISHEIAYEQNFSDMRVGTDKDGSFAFTNVPARRIWGIYPTTESLHGRNLTAGLHLCETISDRQVVNVGKLTLRPGFSVSGKIVLVDRKDVPPGMHVTINPGWTVYNRLTSIAADGTFEIKALAPDVYSLGVGINGYAPTSDSPNKLLVENDRRDVIIRMTPSP